MGDTRKNNFQRVWFLLFVSVSVSLGLFGNALGAILSGTIIDKTTADPLTYANVILRETDLGATTDEQGHYVIQRVPAGEYTLSVSYIGYARQDTVIRVAVTDQIIVDFQLTPESLGGEEVVVTANRIEFEQEVSTSKLSISPREMDIAPAFVEADLFRTIQMLPGVLSQNDFSAALIVRGGSPDENLILLDGVEVYNPYHFGGIFSAFNTTAIRDAVFQSGGFPVKYGGRLSSVLEIYTKEGKPAGGKLGDRWPWADYFDISAISLDISMLSSKAFIEGPLYKGGYFISARRTYFDALARLAHSINDSIPELPYYFYDFQWRTHTQLSKNHRLDFQGYTGSDDLTLQLGDLNYESNSVDFNWIWGNKTRSLSLRSFLRPEMVLESMVSHSNYHFDVDFVQTTTDNEGNHTDTQYLITNNLNDLTFQEKLDWKLNTAHRLQAGLSYKMFQFDFQFDSDDIRYFDESEQPTLASLFLQDTWQMNIRWNWQLGVRAYRYSNSDKFWYDARAGFKFRPLENTALKASAGIFSQFLFTSNQDDAILRIVDFWNAVPDYLDPQRALHYIVGIEQWVGEGYTLSLEGYYKPYLNLLDSNPLQTVYDDNDNFIEGTGLAYGVEAIFKKSTGRLTGWLSYSYSRMTKRIDLNGDGIIEKDQGEEYPPNYDRRHMLNLSINYQINDKNAVGVVWQWSSGQPYTPVVGKQYGGSGTSGWAQPYLNQSNISGKRNSALYPDYLRGDLSYTRTVSIFGAKGEFKFQVLNFTNHFNVLLYHWDHSDSPSTVSATSMFPLIPTMGVSFDF